MVDELVIGLDSSTQSTKAIAWNKDGKDVATGKAEIPMDNPKLDFFEQNPDDPTWWTDTDCLFGECESVELTVVTDGSSPDDAAVDELSAVAKEANKYIHAAAELILENYSREHFASLGIDESLLVNETVDEVANAVTLRSMLVTNAAEKTFEMSFTAPWDSHHSFDVEFENGDAETCAVNG